jgi:hypothetical protein
MILRFESQNEEKKSLSQDLIKFNYSGYFQYKYFIFTILTQTLFCLYI